MNNITGITMEIVGGKLVIKLLGEIDWEETNSGVYVVDETSIDLRDLQKSLKELDEC